MSELRGHLRDLGLVPLVHFLSQQQRTGSLRLSQAGLEGELVFKRGHIASAVTGKERGQPALELITLALAKGDFIYSDEPSDGLEQDLTDTDKFDEEFEQLADTNSSDATPILLSVPHVGQATVKNPDDEVLLSLGDLAVLLAVDGRRTTAEVLDSQPTLHALHTLTHLSEVGVLQLDPPEADAAATPTATVTSVTPTESVSLPNVRAGPAWEWRTLRHVIQVLVLTAVFALVLHAFLQSVHVTGQSMLPGLREGELLLIDRTAYFHDESSVLANVLPYSLQGAMRYPLGGPRRGDLVVFYSPTEPDTEFVKRVIGLPGDDVRIDAGRVFVNDVPLDEPYALGPESEFDNGQAAHVPDGGYFVLGDNRSVSQDSRQGWMVPADSLVGRPWLVYWPPSDWGFINWSAPTTAPATTANAPVVVTREPAATPTPAAILQPPTTEPTVLLTGPVISQAGWPMNPMLAAYDGSAYRLTASRPAQFVAVAAPVVEPLADVTVSAAFHKTGGPPGGGYGIIVRDQDGDARDGINQAGRFYVAEVADDGEIGMWRRDDVHWVDLLPWTPSTAVYVGGTTNELTLRARGPQLTFVVNGHEVASVSDATLPRGRVGAFVGGDYNEVRLDRFSVEVPPAGVVR